MPDNELFNDFMEYKMSSSNSSDSDIASDETFPTLNTSYRPSSRSSSTTQQVNHTARNSSPANRGDSGRAISTLIMLFVVLSFLSGRLPINGVTGIIALICAGILVVRFLCR